MLKNLNILPLFYKICFIINATVFVQRNYINYTATDFVLCLFDGVEIIVLKHSVLHLKI